MASLDDCWFLPAVVKIEIASIALSCADPVVHSLFPCALLVMYISTLAVCDAC